jgi:hypothetical protein
MTGAHGALDGSDTLATEITSQDVDGCTQWSTARQSTDR